MASPDTVTRARIKGIESIPPPAISDCRPHAGAVFGNARR